MSIRLVQFWGTLRISCSVHLCQWISPEKNNKVSKKDRKEGRGCRTIFVHFWNQWSNIYSRFMLWLASCVTLRKKPGLELLPSHLFFFFLSIKQFNFSCEQPSKISREIVLKMGVIIPICIQYQLPCLRNFVVQLLVWPLSIITL